jgi:hypothetical protein
MRPTETTGAAASAAWLAARGLQLAPHWYVEVNLPSADGSAVLDLNIYPEEWGFVFRHATRVSSIRVTDIPFVHGKDDFGLLAHTPPLEQIHDLLGRLEQRFDMTFQSARATVRTNLEKATASSRAWLARGHSDA